MKQKFKHVLITRFNYPEDYAKFDERMNLFKKYTLPNVQNQTNMDFEWIIFSDKELEIDFKNKFFVNLTKYKQYKEELEQEYEYIIETRLDNDDVISLDFINKIQDYFNEFIEYQDNFVIEPRGYRYDARNDTFYEDKFYNPTFSSPFLSLVSKLGSKKYVFDYVHGQMCREYPTYFIKERGWVQIIHSTNKLMNKDTEAIIASRGIKCEEPGWFSNLK